MVHTAPFNRRSSGLTFFPFILNVCQIRDSSISFAKFCCFKKKKLKTTDLHMIMRFIHKESEVQLMTCPTHIISRFVSGTHSPAFITLDEKYLSSVIYSNQETEVLLVALSRVSRMIQSKQLHFSMP